MLALLLGLLALALGAAALSWLGGLDKRVLAIAGWRFLGALALAAATLMVIRGAIHIALPLAMLGLWLISAQGLPATSGGTGAPGQLSQVRTEHLEMVLDHETGEMRGRILKGFFLGRRLESLKPVELAHLWQDCRFVDPDSARLVEAYLDRIHPTWREDMERAEDATPKGPDGRMSREEALEILGLAGAPNHDDVRRAHRELMLKLHPDRGGSTYLAAKVNEAKDVLLGNA